MKMCPTMCAKPWESLNLNVIVFQCLKSMWISNIIQNLLWLAIWWTLSSNCSRLMHIMIVVPILTHMLLSLAHDLVYVTFSTSFHLTWGSGLLLCMACMSLIVNNVKHLFYYLLLLVLSQLWLIFCYKWS